jgi:hypothetical protein
MLDTRQNSQARDIPPDHTTVALSPGKKLRYGRRDEPGRQICMIRDPP